MVHHPQLAGFLPQFLGFELCQRIRRILADTREYAYLHPSSAATLAAQRAAFAGLLEAGSPGIEVDTDEIRWWTFAGGRINATLRHALQALHPDWKLIPDNFLLKVRAKNLHRDELEAAIQRMLEPEFWEDAQLWREVAETLPNYRLSKFQSLMPPWVERETVAGFLLDLPGSWRWLSRTWQVASLAPDLERPR